MAFEENIKLKKWGNSQGILLSKDLLKKINIDFPINEDLKLKINYDKKSISLSKANDTIDDMFKNFDYIDWQKNRSKDYECDFGEPVGKEVW
ncbi:AbrB/MazE/SpoVT family DNA-binding domain-containing protein [Apilactobacillus micheneri]|uniref:AbrB/MazE/SpoVT family DNA-binding domain-containing protein n=1 Tax=Apilactobacillus micheneri TaxID=1899430 RepID=UPI000D047BB2|nr:AbrB/MazE/SpoVT family DNA-binding domain-containing protein [Apilactobacillus micheneri]